MTVLDIPAPPAGRRRWWTAGWSLASVRWAAAATTLFVGGTVVLAVGGPTWLIWSMYLACYATGGWGPALAGLRALRERTLDVDLLMIVAAIGAAGIGQIFDGTLLIVIFAASGALEDVATRRTEESVRGLLDLAPEQATRLDADGSEVVVAASSLQPGQVIAIRPGERIAADATVIAGASDVDQSSITGEPLPVAKTISDPIFAGTLNGTGSLHARVDTAAVQTVVARIVAMVTASAATKAATQLFIEKVERTYSIVVVAATVLMFAVPLACGADLQTTLLRAMTFMIVASPCAVVLATMPPLLSAIATAGRHGVLVKSAVAMEKLADITIVALDKTGTLTTGHPTVTDVIATGDHPREHILTMAAATERDSEHPLGRAIVAAARWHQLTIPSATRFRAFPGHGVQAHVHGRLIEVITAGVTDTAASVAAARHEIAATGGTTVAVIDDGEVIGVLGLHDRLRPEAAPAVAAITAITGTAPSLLTGDNHAAAQHVSQTVGIRDVHADLLPEHKVAALTELRTARDTRIAVVGDGINDAPALAAADIGIAMGGIGADLTLATAEVVIVRDDLTDVATLLHLARRARRIVIANLAIAAGVIVGLVTWDLFGHLPLPLGVAGHEGSTIIVALNGLRLLTPRAWSAPLEAA